MDEFQDEVFVDNSRHGRASTSSLAWL